MNFSAVILAGGRSSRMGQDKAWLSFGGRPLIQHSLSVVRDAGASEVLISGHAGQDFSALGCPVLLDATPDSGPLGGVERALSVAEGPLVLVLAVDLPRMTVGCLRWLSGGWRAEAPGQDALPRVPPGGSAVGAVPVLRDQPEPLAAFYPKRAHEIATRMLGEQRLSARGFAEACIQQGMAGGVTVGADHEACFFNWNTPEDITAAST